jgi:hypothetical protein
LYVKFVQAEKFGNSFALEPFVSEAVKENITQAVSGRLFVHLGLLHFSQLSLHTQWNQNMRKQYFLSCQHIHTSDIHLF